MNIKLKKFNTLLTLLALLSIGSLFANEFQLGKVTVDTTVSNKNITVSYVRNLAFDDLYSALVEDSLLRSVLLDNNNNNKFKHLYYGNKKLAIDDNSTTLASLEIKANQAITLTTAAPKPKEDKAKDKTNPTNTNNGNDGGDDDKKGLWKNHKYKFIIGGISAGALALAGGAYFMLNSGQESETEKA